MDPKELNNRLVVFFETCADRNCAIDEMCIVPAYPGIADSSYNLHIKSEWCNGMICSVALEKLIDILFDTTDIETRKYIFYIRILDRNEEISCQEGIEKFNYRAA